MITDCRKACTPAPRPGRESIVGWSTVLLDESDRRPLALCPECLAKLDRIETIYREQVADTPAVFFETLAAQRERLLATQAAHGDYVEPATLAG